MRKLVRLLCFAVAPAAWAAPPFVTVQATMHSTGALDLRVSPPRPEIPFDSASAARIVHCPSTMHSSDPLLSTYYCANGLRRDGLALEAV